MKPKMCIGVPDMLLYISIWLCATYQDILRLRSQFLHTQKDSDIHIHQLLLKYKYRHADKGLGDIYPGL